MNLCDLCTVRSRGARALERRVEEGQVGALRKSEFSFSGKFCIFLIPNVAPSERKMD